MNSQINFRMLFFSGIMTALAGALLGVIIAHIAERESRRPVAIVVGSGVGFAIGVGYEAMQQNREQEETD
ncbi:conserved hypothetical protein [Hyella patelloides LEGE 07179]|uniref:Uncharacterized protein n=1 Tax=Hyella patelloides LEGE 07179 TaxID=945734 RepID=A0A563VWP6_9CYAN|nr:hypothetical protein [Hyella patelloides]VEP15673.1 conserved hypothetical protein [Hyella patelloides LEGE 07179]